MVRVAGERERGDVILGWLTRLVVVLSLVAVVGYDGISLLASRLRVADSATRAALAASEAWPPGRVPSTAAQTSFDAAQATLHPGDRVDAPSFTVTGTGTVDLTVESTASTLLLRRIGPLRHLAYVQAHGHAAGR